MKIEQELRGVYMNRCKSCGKQGFIVDAENGLCSYCKASNRKPISEVLDLEANTLKVNEKTKSDDVKSKKKKVVSDSGIV